MQTVSLARRPARAKPDVAARHGCNTESEVLRAHAGRGVDAREIEPGLADDLPYERRGVRIVDRRRIASLKRNARFAAERCRYRYCERRDPLLQALADTTAEPPRSAANAARVRNDVASMPRMYLRNRNDRRLNRIDAATHDTLQSADQMRRGKNAVRALMRHGAVT